MLSIPGFPPGSDERREATASTLGPGSFLLVPSFLPGRGRACHPRRRPGPAGLLCRNALAGPLHSQTCAWLQGAAGLVSGPPPPPDGSR